MAKVLVFAPVGDAHIHLVDAGHDVVLGDRAWHSHSSARNERELVVAARGAAALCGSSMRATPISRDVLEAANDLRIVAKATVGVDDVDVIAATELGIAVTHAPIESNYGAIAELTVTMMLVLAKRLLEQDRTIKDGGWWTEGEQGRYVGRRASDGYPGLVLGVIGLGRIGMRVAKLLQPWGIRIVATDPYVPPHRFIEAGAESLPLDQLLTAADVVSLHVTHTAETERMMSTAQFDAMKPGSIFINTARGKCVDEEALCAALHSGRLAGAGLNAFYVEPLDPSSPLRNFEERVLLRPHGGVVPPGAKAPGRVAGQATDWMNEDVLRALRGEPPIHLYNRDVAELWLSRFAGRPV